MNRKQRRAARKLERSAAHSSTKPQPPRELALALAHMRAGRLPEAAAELRHILATDPQDAPSLHHLGLIEHRLGNHETAADLIRQCLVGNPDNANMLSDLGAVLAALGRGDEAMAACETAIALCGEHAAAHCNLGNVLKSKGRLPEATRAYARAVAMAPGFAAAHANLADALAAQKQLDEALAACERAIALAPRLAEAHGIRAQILHKQGRNEEAFAAYGRALELNPGLVGLHTEAGNILRLQGAWEAAIAAHWRTIALAPGHAEGHCHLGITLQGVGRWAEAHDAYQQALQLAPDYAEAWSNLGVLLHLQGRPEDAVAAFRKAVALNPRLANAHYNMAGALDDLGRLEEAIGALRQALACDPGLVSARFALCNLRHHACDWRGLETEEAECLASVGRAGVRVPPFPVLAMTGDLADQLVHARTWARGLAIASSQTVSRRRAVGLHQDGRIRIGYLSADFRRHATASLIAELLERHDRRRFEIVGYCFSADDGSDMRRRLITAFDRFVDIRKLTHAEAARRIGDDGIDILVDLKGYTKDARSEILGYRPAPIQVSYLGYPGTLGADFIDYIIADPFVAPMHQQARFTEQIVHLPDCYQPNDTRRAIAEPAPTRAHCGLPDGALVFASFNNAYKITPAVFAVWMRLLAAVEGSVLWLLDANPLAKANLRREAAERGIDPSRLVFAPKLPAEQHLARQRLADLFLDTLPVNAHTTASDALWAGLPVLTCAGEAFVGRVAGSLLQAIGLPELVTHTLQDYEALALRLATEPELLAGLRRRLQANRRSAPLFDAERYVANIEAAYAHMAARAASGQAPRAFAVADLEQDRTPVRAAGAQKKRAGGGALDAVLAALAPIGENEPPALALDEPRRGSPGR